MKSECLSTDFCLDSSVCSDCWKVSDDLKVSDHWAFSEHKNAKGEHTNYQNQGIKDTTRLRETRALAGSFPPKICGDFAPLRRFPFAQGHFRIGICLQPAFGPFNHLIELLCARSPRQSGAAFLLLDPQQGVAAVGINGEWRTHLLEQGQGMNNGQELTDIVGAINRAVMKHHLPRLEINATIFHLTRIS